MCHEYSKRGTASHLWGLAGCTRKGGHIKGCVNKRNFEAKYNKVS